MSNLKLSGQAINSYLIKSVNEILLLVILSNEYEVNKMSFSELSGLMSILKEVYKTLNISVKINDFVSNQLDFGTENYIDCDVRSILISRLMYILPAKISGNIIFNRTGMIDYFNDVKEEENQNSRFIFSETQIFNPDNFKTI